MCTAATYQTKDFYFGRNLDYEFGYGETVTFTPRRYPFQLNGLGRAGPALCHFGHGLRAE